MNQQTKVKAGDTLHSAMALAFAEIEAATKGAENSHFKSKYADLTSIIQAVKPALISNGLFFTQHPQPSDRGITVETVLHHASGESISLGALFVPANKQDPQGFGSALTYARRYALQTAFGVPVEDDDGNAAVKAGPEKTGLITDGQWNTLTQLLTASGVSAERLCKFFDVDNLKQLPADKFDEACEKLTATIAKAKERVPA